MLNLINNIFNGLTLEINFVQTFLLAVCEQARAFWLVCDYFSVLMKNSLLIIIILSQWEIFNLIKIVNSTHTHNWS